jgi:branched-chain amino acid transport system permease protein
MNGLSLGSLYALVAIGYTMVYGILRLINFAHGDLLMVAAYAGLYGIGIFSLPWPLAFGLAVTVTVGLGLLLEKAAYKPLRQAPRLSLFISAIGVSFLLENLALVLLGGRPQAFPTVGLFAGVIPLGPLFLPRLSLWIFSLTAVALLALFGVVYYTRLGMAMRAIAYDLETSRLQGINVDRVISLTFMLGSGLAGLGGLLWALKYPQVNPFMGVLPGLKAFIAAVAGGIGNLTGAVVGGLLLGILEVLIVALLPDWAGYRDALAFGLLMLVLLCRPQGLLGAARLEEKL